MLAAATPQSDCERLSPKEIHDLSSLQGEALVYTGNPQASPIPKTVGWVASVHNLLIQQKPSAQKSIVQHITLLCPAHIQSGISIGKGYPEHVRWESDYDENDGDGDDHGMKCHHKQSVTP